jgi:hypothetical protein
MIFFLSYWLTYLERLEGTHRRSDALPSVAQSESTLSKLAHRLPVARVHVVVIVPTEKLRFARFHQPVLFCGRLFNVVPATGALTELSAMLSDH